MSETTSSRTESHVLVVEDSKINRIVVLQMLKRAAGDGLEVIGTEAAGGREALELLRNNTYDLVLMDVQMPEMDGLATTRAIRSGHVGRENRNVPVIAMTAFATASDEKACYDAGMTGYLAKPLRLQQFIVTVRSALED